MGIELITIKATPEALRMLRLIAAYTGDKQYKILERVLGKELERIQRREANATKSSKQG